MDAAASSFTKHLAWPVPDRGTTLVQLFVGSEQREIAAGRFKRFSEMMLISQSTCSRRTTDLTALRPRTLVKRAISAYGTPIRLGYFFDTRFMETNNISHLLMDVLPMCLRVRSVVPDAAFVFRPLGATFRELLSYFEIEPICTYRPVTGTELSFRLTRGLSMFDIEAGFDVPLYSYIEEIYSEYFSAECETPKKIFISRRNSRVPVNEADVIAMLASRGFSVVYMEDYPIVEQIRLIQEAQDIVAIHGAAMSFLVLKEHTRTLIELLPPNVHHEHFPAGLGHKVGKLFQLIPSFDENVQYLGWSAISQHKNAAFSIDLKQLELALQSAGL